MSADRKKLLVRVGMFLIATAEMDKEKKKLILGVSMLLSFVVVLLAIFLPIFNGTNAMVYADSLYNSISKGSVHYIPEVKKESDLLTGDSISITLTMADEQQANQTARLFASGGAEAVAAGAEIEVSGDLGKILESCLADADAMYNNDGEAVSGKYGYDEKLALYNWWNVLKGMEVALKGQKEFKQAKVVALVKKKAVETAYNYYGIQPQKISDRLGIVIFSLIFYVLYTLWYGFAIMFTLEGCNLKLGH